MMKFKKYIWLAICSTVLLVAGCSDYPTDEQFIEARSWCDDFGGVKTTDFGESTGLRVICIDGAIIAKMYSN